MKNRFPIYWIYEGKEHTGYAAYNEASTGCNAYIAFSTWQNESKTASETFDRIDADQLPGGEAELREIWEDLLSDASASEDGRLNVTDIELI